MIESLTFKEKTDLQTFTENSIDTANQKLDVEFNCRILYKKYYHVRRNKFGYQFQLQSKIDGSFRNNPEYTGYLNDGESFLDAQTCVSKAIKRCLLEK